MNLNNNNNKNSNNYLLFLSSWRPNMVKRYYKNNMFLQNIYLSTNSRKVMSINKNFDIYTSSQSKKINILIPDKNIINERKTKTIVGQSTRNLGNMCNKLGICIQF